MRTFSVLSLIFLVVLQIVLYRWYQQHDQPPVVAREVFRIRPGQVYDISLSRPVPGDSYEVFLFFPEGMGTSPDKITYNAVWSNATFDVYDSQGRKMPGGWGTPAPYIPYEHSGPLNESQNFVYGFLMPEAEETYTLRCVFLAGSPWPSAIGIQVENDQDSRAWGFTHGIVNDILPVLGVITAAFFVLVVCLSISRRLRSSDERQREVSSA